MFRKILRWMKGPEEELPTLIEHRDNPRNKAAVVFIHGYGGHPKETWGEFPRLLIEDPQLSDWDVYSVGYHTRVVPDVLRGFWAAEAPIPRLGQMLRTRAGAGSLGRYPALALVAHSMGGLVTQHALLDPAFRARVQVVVLFGTPSGGLWKAVPVSLLKQQLRDMSRFSLSRLRLRWRWKREIGQNPDFLFWAVAGDRDEFVTADSSLGPFASEKVVDGNHLSMVKPKQAAHDSYQLLKKALLHGAEKASPYQSARVAVERGRHREAIKLLEGHANELDTPGLVTLALALDSIGRRDDAERLLLAREEALRGQGGAARGAGTDLLGTLGGRIKRRWLHTRKESDVERACELYQKAYAISSAEPIHHEQAYYHAINVAFFELYYRKSPASAAQWARSALEHCDRSLEAVGQQNLPDMDSLWRNATQGEALLVLGRTDEALTAYRRALAQEPESWQRLSMYTQGRLVAETTRNQAAIQGLEELFLRPIPPEGS